jgi:short-subunit dehydrogenase
MHFKNKIVWITGASSGIGKELAIQLAKQQAILILTARNESALQQLQEQLAKVTIVHILPFDLYEIHAIESLVQKAIQFTGKIDYIIQSAGVSQRALIDDTNLEVHRKIMEINYFAPLAITKFLLPHFKHNSKGHFVVISSVAGLYGFPLRSGYAASKHALKGFMETLQTEFFTTNINATIVFPGRINTPISTNALSGNGKNMGVEDENNSVGMDVTICANKIIKGVQKNNKTIYIGTPEKILFYIWWFLPNLFLKIANNKGLK